MENTLINSFFDTNESSFKLWTPASSKKAKKERPVLTSDFLKRSKQSSVLTKRSFILTENHLFYRKISDGDKIRGAMKLEWVRAEFYAPGEAGRIDEFEDTKDMYVIKFIRNMKFTEIFTEEKEVFHKWRLALRKLIIVTDFHQEFEVLKLIGKGSFARVRI